MSSVDSGDERKINIICPEHLGDKGELHALWNLQASVKQIREGDIICRLQRAPKLMIIRAFKDYFTVIRIAISPEGKKSKVEISNGQIFYNWQQSLCVISYLSEAEKIL